MEKFCPFLREKLQHYSSLTFHLKKYSFQSIKPKQESMSLFHLAMPRLFLQEVKQVIFKFLMKAQLKKREIMKESC
jgi:hypothetical protein